MHLARRALHLGEPVQLAAEFGAQLVDVHSRLEQQRTKRAALAVQEGQQHMGRLEELMVTTDGKGLRIGERLLEAAREFVHPHGNTVKKDHLECVPKWGPRAIRSRAWRATARRSEGPPAASQEFNGDSRPALQSYS